jgi:N6-adenosine-specific RNA methylase IME4
MTACPIVSNEAAKSAEAVRLRAENPTWGYIKIGRAIGLHKDRVRRAIEHAERKRPNVPAITTTGNALSLYDTASRALAEAKNLTEVKDIADRASALKEYARRANDRHLEIDAAELRIRAERRLGEMLAVTELNHGKRGDRGPRSAPRSDSRPTLAEIGIDKKLSSRAQKLASISERAIEARIATWRQGAERGAERVTVDLMRDGDKKERRAAREAELGEKIAAGNLAFPTELFGVIVADPQWGRTVYSEETGVDRHAGNHYPVASGDEATQDDAIKAQPVASIAAKDCVLGLWCTEPWRGEAVMRAWGFEPVAYFVWAKDIIVIDPADNGMLRSGQRLEVTGAAGLGFWNRDRCEIMLIGTQGKPVCPAPGTQGERVWFARRGEHATTRDEIHSDKPDCSLEWFERHWPNTPKIELNARRARPGWKTWGLDAPDASAHDPDIEKSPAHCLRQRPGETKQSNEQIPQTPGGVQVPAC